MVLLLLLLLLQLLHWHGGCFLLRRDAIVNAKVDSISSKPTNGKRDGTIAAPSSRRSALSCFCDLLLVVVVSVVVGIYSCANRRVVCRAAAPKKNRIEHRLSSLAHSLTHSPLRMNNE